MKIVHRILLILVVIATLSSCTQRRYGHITGFQLKKNTKTEKVTARKGHYVNPSVETIQEEISAISENDIPASIESVQKSNDITVASFSKNEESSNMSNRFKKKAELAEPLPGLAKVANTLKPKNIVKEVKSKVGKKTKAGGLIYWILVLILLVLIVSLLESVLGTALTRIIITIILIAFIGHLIGLW